jgi:alpha-beta hydrolase superfamily lysophospholipase
MLAAVPTGALRVPTTLVLADRDRIIDNARTRQAVDRLTGWKAVAQVLPGAHTLEFEEDPAPLYQALAAAVARGEAPPEAS